MEEQQPANDKPADPVLFDWRVWTNWQGSKCEAIDMLNGMLRPHGLKIHVEWNSGDDFTTVSILNEIDG